MEKEIYLKSAQTKVHKAKQKVEDSICDIYNSEIAKGSALTAIYEIIMDKHIISLATIYRILKRRGLKQ